MPSIRRKTCEKSVRIKYASNVSFESGRKGEKCSDIYFIIFLLAFFWAEKLITETSKEKLWPLTQKKLRGSYLKL